MSGGEGGHLALTPWRAWVRGPLARSGGGVRRIACLVLALTSVRTVWAGECTVPPIASLGYACRGPCGVSLGPSGPGSCSLRFWLGLYLGAQASRLLLERAGRPRSQENGVCCLPHVDNCMTLGKRLLA